MLTLSSIIYVAEPDASLLLAAYEAGNVGRRGHLQPLL